jgi:hypothetical protein
MNGENKMRQCNYFLIAIFMTLGAAMPGICIGQEGLGGVPGSYMYMGVGARALGMGGAYSAVADDATAVYWNPAGLAQQNPFRVSFMHAVLFLDTALDFFAASAPTEKFGSFGAALMALNSSGFEQRTALNEVVGNFNTRDMTIMASWSKQLMGNFSFGLSYKYVTQKILNYSGSGHGLDLGLKTFLFDRINAGLVLRNLVKPSILLASEGQSYPTQIGIGASTSLVNDQLLVSAEVSKINGWGEPVFHLGAEYRVMNQAAILIGANRNSFTFGAGITFDAFDFSYSNIGGSDLGSSHRFSLDYAFGGFGVNARAYPKIFSPSGEMSVTRIRLKAKSREPIENWSFAIFDAQNKPVMEYSQAGTPPKEIVWDGRSGTGTLAADGQFHYVFKVKTMQGNVLNSEGKLVTIDSKGPQGVFASSEEE